MKFMKKGSFGEIFVNDSFVGDFTLDDYNRHGKNSGAFSDLIIDLKVRDFKPESARRIFLKDYNIAKKTICIYSNDEILAFFVPSPADKTSYLNDIIQINKIKQRGMELCFLNKEEVIEFINRDHRT